MPRVAAGLGASGIRSITRNRYSSGQVMKSAARDGDSDGPAGGRPSSSGSSGDSPSSGVAASGSAPPVVMPGL